MTEYMKNKLTVWGKMSVDRSHTLIFSCDQRKLIKAVRKYERKSLA